MPSPSNNNQQHQHDLEQENQRLRQQVDRLQRQLKEQARLLPDAQTTLPKQPAQLDPQRQNEILTAEFAAKTQELQATELRFKRLADNLPGVIFQYRLEPDGTQSFPYVSEKTREVYEVEPEDFLKVFDLIHPDDADRLQSTIQESAKKTPAV